MQVPILVTDPWIRQHSTQSHISRLQLSQFFLHRVTSISGAEMQDYYNQSKLSKPSHLRVIDIIIINIIHMRMIRLTLTLKKLAIQSYGSQHLLNSTAIPTINSPSCFIAGVKLDRKCGLVGIPIFVLLRSAECLHMHYQRPI